MNSPAKSDAPAPRVLIVGGGVAGVEAMLAVRALLGERAEVVVAAPRRDFVYKPFAVGEPYGAAQILRLDLERIAEDCGARFEWASVSRVEPDLHVARLHDGAPLRYDYLVYAAGVRLLWPFPGATTFWGVADEVDIEEVLAGAREGRIRSIAFTSPGVSSWALPLYELALLTQADLEKAGVGDVELTVVTPEAAPLGVFGTRAGVEVAELLAGRGIALVTGVHPVKFEDGLLVTAPGAGLRADAVLSLPRLQGRQIEGIPHDRDGFVPTDGHGRIAGLDHAFAIGDVTTFPVKQGGIATQQADLAAEAIAAEVTGAPKPDVLDPVLRGVLWTGAEPRYLYGELGGGHGETSAMSESAPWPEQSGKVVGRYITPYLAGALEPSHS